MAEEDESTAVLGIVTVGAVGVIAALNFDKIRDFIFPPEQDTGGPDQGKIEKDCSQMCDLKGLGGYGEVCKYRNPLAGGRFMWVWPGSIADGSYKHAFETCDELLEFAKTQPQPGLGTYIQNVDVVQSNRIASDWIPLGRRGKIAAITGWWKAGGSSSVNEKELWVQTKDDVLGLVGGQPILGTCLNGQSTRGFDPPAAGGIQFGTATHIRFGGTKGKCLFHRDSLVDEVHAQLTVVAV